MSCSSCSQPSCSGNCIENRLSLGMKGDFSAIIGSLDGVYLIPIPMKPMVKANETNTNLKYDPARRALVFENEKSKNNKGSSDYVTTQEILAGSSLAEIGGVESLIEGGLASVVVVDDKLYLQFSIPSPIGIGELSGGFVTYVSNPADGVHYKLVRPESGGTTDTLLVGHPNGSVEFAAPIESPVLVPVNTLTSNGVFSGTPSTSSGTWRYQQMGQSQVITNTSGSEVEVELAFRYSMQTAGSRSGVYAELVNGGSDYKTTFAEGVANLKQEGYPGGMGKFSVILESNQRCQFKFGGWTNAAGSMVITIGSVNESAGSTVQTAQPPVISIRRLI